MADVSVRHSGNVGDLLAALPAMREFSRQNKTPITLYCWLNRHASYYEGAIHPVIADGKTVMMNQYMFDMVRPLLLAQDYIEEVKVWSGEKIHCNMDTFRDGFINMPYGSINRWQFIAYPNLTCDLSKGWIHIPWNSSLKVNLAGINGVKLFDSEKGIDFFMDKFILNRTQRYTNPMINYFFLKEVQDKVIFAGTEGEHAIFCNEFKLSIPLLKIKNFLELTQVILASRFFIGNQSQCAQICEGLKSPRIIELCRYAPNVIPVGEHAYDFYGQLELEYHVNFLLNKK